MFRSPVTRTKASLKTSLACLSSHVTIRRPTINHQNNHQNNYQPFLFLSPRKSLFFSTTTRMSSLVPLQPSSVLTIRSLNPYITIVSLPFLRFSRIPIGGRCTIAKLTSGTLAAFSPTALTPEVRTAIQNLGGDVAYIVCPDIEHHLFLTEWKTAFPTAKILAPEGLQEKRAAAAKKPQDPNSPAVTDIPIDFIFTATATPQLPPDFTNTFTSLYIPSHANRELVLLHKPTATLLEADLLFNLPATEQFARDPTTLSTHSGLLTRIFNALNHTDEARGITWPRIMQYYVFAKDRADYAERMRTIAGWQFENVVPCHGDVMEGDGKERFLNVMKWFMEGKEGKKD